MTASMRLGIAAFAAALTLAPAAAQDTTQPPTTNTPAPATDVIGPRELRDFNLNGTVTRPVPAPTPAPAESPPAAVPAPRSAAPADRVPSSPPADQPPAPASGAPPIQSPDTPAAESPLTTAPAAESTPAPLPPTGGFSTQPNFTPPVIPDEASRPTDQNGSLVPWLLAALLAAGGIGYLAWRQNRRQLAPAAAGHAQAFESPPQPQPAPPPAAPAPSASPGLITSTRLRPWLEIEFVPGRCIIDGERATLEFDLAIMNSGAAPARDVLVEAWLLNAGPEQDDQIARFFSKPVGNGQPVEVVPPLKRVALPSAIALTREQMKIFDAGGRKFFVPMLAFNALYRWSGGEGQTSASYLVGRDTKGEKLAPFRVDLGARVFRGLGAREHELRVRR